MHPVVKAMLLGALNGALDERRALGVELNAEAAGAELARQLRAKIGEGERRWLAEVAESIGRGLR